MSNSIEEVADAVRRAGVWTADGTPKPIPQSWAEQRHESFKAGQRRFYATLAHVTADDTTVDESRIVRVLYLRANAAWAFSREYDAIEGTSGLLPDPETFYSSLMKPPTYGNPVPEEERDPLLHVLSALYASSEDEDEDE